MDLTSREVRTLKALLICPGSVRLPHREQRLDWRVSPLLSTVREPLAPAYLFVAEYDPLHDEGLAYRDWLVAGGNEVTFARVEWLTHDFLRMSGIVGQVGEIYQDVGGWLKKLGG